MNGPELVDQVKKNGFVWHAENWKHNNEFHHHHKAQLVFVDSGYQYLHTTDNQFLLPQHHAAWIPSNVPHKTTAASESVSLRTLYFNTDGMPPFYDDLYLFSVPPVLREMIMYTEKWSLNMKYRQSEQTFLLAILEELPSFIQESIPLITPVPKSANLIAVTAFIHQAYGAPISIDDLATKGFVSVRTLERQFKKETGISLAKYIQMVRIIKSLELLSEGELNISEIAFRVGYSSAQSYSNVFMKLLGKRPSAYFEPLVK